METERIYVWVCFLFCLGLTAGGVLTFFREKSIRSYKPVLLFQYFLILIYTFGFYSLWSGIFYRLVLGAASGINTGGEVPSFLALIGLPFLLSGLIMLVLWAFRLSTYRTPLPFYAGGFLLTSLVLFLYFLWQDFDWRYDIQRLYAILWITITLLTAIFLSVSRVHHLSRTRKMFLIMMLIITGAVQLPILIMKNIQAFQPAFAFLFFLTNTLFGLFFVYAVKPSLIVKEEKTYVELNFTSFFEMYGITPRESEVILQIYSGKTNKEIADKLFVTVQTIKDHTHRIYQKTNIKNRTLLASELRKFDQEREVGV